MNSFVSLAYACLADSRTLFQWLLARLNFPLDSEDYFYYYKWKNDIYELRQKHMQLKTMEMSEDWPYNYNEGYIHQFQYEPTHKITNSSRNTEFKDILPWNISQMITETLLISKRIAISYAMTRGISFWDRWNVNGNWDNNVIKSSQWRESHCRTNTSFRGNETSSRTMRVTVRDPSRRVNHLSKVVWNRKIITEFFRSISSTRIG